MQKCVRALCVFLCITLLFVSIFVPAVSAQEIKGRITGDGVRIRKEPNIGCEWLGRLEFNTVVTVNSEAEGEVVDGDYGNTWYNVTYNDVTGYVYGKYLEKIVPIEQDEGFEADILSFPESYRAALREIHDQYPNWVFIADNLDISLDDAINLEYGSKKMSDTRKWVELTYGLEWRDPRVDAKNPDHIRENRWTYASRKAIAYFMDPRNGLVLSNKKSSLPNIFTFLEQSYNPATQNEAGLRTVIAGTFLSTGYDGDADAYLKDIMAAASESGVSPYIIASTIITEQGIKGTSRIISGAYEGYEGYYNYFNYGANGSNIVENGLKYAKEKGWNSRRASIIGGAKEYESGYLSSVQDTYYYMDFNVKQPSRIWHQYATSLYDQCVKGSSVRTAYSGNTAGALTFKIPVYALLPEEVCPMPGPEDYVTEPAEDPGDEPGDEPGDDPGGEPGGEPTQEPEPIPDPTPPRRKGDTDGDGEITVKDFARMRMHILGVRWLDGDDLVGGDINSDLVIDVKDLARIRMHLLHLITLE